MPTPIDPIQLSRLVTAAVALLCVQHPEALKYPREHLRRLATERVLATLRDHPRSPVPALPPLRSR